MKKYLFLGSFLLMQLCLKAQNQDEQVKATVETFFRAMHTNDSLLMKSVVHPACQLNSVILTKDTSPKLASTPMDAFYKAIGTKRAGTTLEEKLLDHKIMVDEALAVDWTPYEFYVNNILHHKGTNMFTLVKLSDKWVINNIIDTRKN